MTNKELLAAADFDKLPTVLKMKYNPKEVLSIEQLVNVVGSEVYRINLSSGVSQVWYHTPAGKWFREYA